jgi:hypothetical protein
MAKKHKKLAYILTVFIIVMAFGVLVNLFNIQMPLVNPAPGRQTDYSQMLVVYPENNPSNPAIALINLTIFSNGPLVEGQPFTLYVVGELYNSAYTNITDIVVAPGEIVDYPPTYDAFGIAVSQGIHLYPLVTSVGTKFGAYQSTFQFTASGTSVPDIAVEYSNGFRQDAFYANNAITVYPPSYISEAQLNHVNYILTIALLFFAFVEGIAIIREFLEG